MSYAVSQLPMLPECLPVCSRYESAGIRMRAIFAKSLKTSGVRDLGQTRAVQAVPTEIAERAGRTGGNPDDRWAYDWEIIGGSLSSAGGRISPVCG